MSGWWCAALAVLALGALLRWAREQARHRLDRALGAALAGSGVWLSADEADVLAGLLLAIRKSYPKTDLEDARRAEQWAVRLDQRPGAAGRERAS